MNRSEAVNYLADCLEVDKAEVARRIEGVLCIGNRAGKPEVLDTLNFEVQGGTESRDGEMHEATEKRSSVLLIAGSVRFRVFTEPFQGWDPATGEMVPRKTLKFVALSRGTGFGDPETSDDTRKVHPAGKGLSQSSGDGNRRVNMKPKGSTRTW